MARKTKHEFGSDGVEKPPRTSLFAWLRARFFAGMVIAAPIAITFLVLQFVIDFFDETITPLLPRVVKPETYTQFAIPGFGLVITVVALTILGAVTTNLIGRSAVRMSDRILLQIPVVRNVYSAFKQLFEVFANNTTGQFDEVVMVQFPREGSWCVGFVSSPAKGEIGAKLPTGRIGVFVPTTPNPTSGFLMFVDEEEVIRLDMSVEEGAKVILTAGLVVPEQMPLKEGESLPEPKVASAAE